ncbi:MAG: CAP domain-containing protein [Pyrinomonadaceae bacterium]
MPISAQSKAVLVDQIGGRQVPLRPTVKLGSSAGRSSASAVVAAERRAFLLMNAQRQANGLGALQWDEELADLARLHARNMSEGKFFSHRGLDGTTVDQRAARLGIKWTGIGENIAALRGHDDPASYAVEKWMNSNSHRKNILYGAWRTSAIGAFEGDDGTIYFTQVFVYN